MLVDGYELVSQLLSQSFVLGTQMSDVMEIRQFQYRDYSVFPIVTHKNESALARFIDLFECETA